VQNSVAAQTHEKYTKLRPLSLQVAWRVLKYDRKTKEGLKITRVARVHCDDCRDHKTIESRRNQAQEALAQAQQCASTNVVKLQEALMRLEAEEKKLSLHQEWYRRNRPNIDLITDDLKWGKREAEAQIFIDFFKVYASDSRAVKSLSFVLYRNSEQDSLGYSHVEYIDNWFRGSSSGLSAVRVFESVLASDTFKDVSRLFVSSDTGNGFRGYELYDFFSCVKSRYGITIDARPLCPNHGWSQADRRFGNLKVAIKVLKDKSRIVRLAEFAAISREVADGSAVVHDDGIDSEQTTFLDGLKHPPFVPPCRPEGLKKIGHAQFCWRLDDGTEFAQDHFCRVQSFVDGTDWQYWDLRPQSLPLCVVCTTRAQKPVRHDKKTHCPGVPIKRPSIVLGAQVYHTPRHYTFLFHPTYRMYGIIGRHKCYARPTERPASRKSVHQTRCERG
jgi:hypothetical protein